MWVLTRESVGFDTRKSLQKIALNGSIEPFPANSVFAVIYSNIFYTQRVFNSHKEYTAIFDRIAGTKRPVRSRLYPRGSQNSSQFLNSSPRFCRACRPTPRRHFAKAKLAAAVLLAFGCGARAGGTGSAGCAGRRAPCGFPRPAYRTRPICRPQCASPTKAGGYSARPHTTTPVPPRATCAPTAVSGREWPRLAVPDQLTILNFPVVPL